MRYANTNATKKEREKCGSSVGVNANGNTGSRSIHVPIGANVNTYPIEVVNQVLCRPVTN